MTVTVWIDGLEYLLEQRNHNEFTEPLRSVSRGLTGKHIIQDFGATDTTIDLTILCYLFSAPEPGYGVLSDLKAAWAKTTFDFTDVNGEIFTAIPQGKLDISKQFSLVDLSAPFPVRLKVVRYDS